MAPSTQTTPRLSTSFFAYPDGSNLSWQSFREIILSPRRIHLHDPSPAIGMPNELLIKIQSKLDNIERFDEQRCDFRKQISLGRGFGDSPIWPPNSLPPVQEHSQMQRASSPKFSREALPLRAPADRGPLMDLPTPRPALACGFTSETFTEIELSNLPSPLTSSGTIVHFETGLVAPGVPLHCPFFVFERVKGLTEDSVESAKNQCALSGSTCVRALQQLYGRAFGGNGSEQKPVAFSCTIDNAFAIINYHWLSYDEEYNMTSLCKFDLTKDDHFNKFQAWVEAIEDWAITRLLPKIKAAVHKLACSTDTPPLSPMPSLSLSVDTSAGADDTLMKALRTTFSSIKWRYHGIGETPIMSSIAQCGTPLPARRMRSLALSPITPQSPGARGFRSIKLNIPVALSKAAWHETSPESRRFELSPLRWSGLPPDSPARPGTLSPCSPPIDAPFAPFNPVLVLQRRLDHAMDEIQELKKQLELVNREMRIRKTETQSEPASPAIDMLEALAKRVDTIESDRAGLARIPSLASLSRSAKDMAARAANAVEPRYLRLGASLVAAVSILVLGSLLGYRLVESLSCLLPPCPNWLHPRRHVAPLRSAFLRIASF